MSESVYKLTLGESTYELTDCVSENERVYAKSPRRSLSGDLIIGNLNTYFVPRLHVKISLLSVLQYAELIKYVKNKSFTLKYYDDELKSVVDRVMTLKSLKKGRLVGNSFIGTEAEFESVNSYGSIESLTEGAAENGCC